jgi:hypothetical protein
MADRALPATGRRPGAGDARLPAGTFSTWLEAIEGALDGEQGSDVPCGSCTACCRSGQFVHIEPDETDTLAHIPAPLLFPAPQRPRGHVVMGHDQQGHCPMLVGDACSIYEHRPRACRTYDCRVFAAAGIAADKPFIQERARRWRFDLPSSADRARLGSVRAAARSIGEHPERLPDGAAPANATATALLAIEIHDAFLDVDPGNGEAVVVDADPVAVRVALQRRRDSGGRA